jgi:glycosyltransferase involved in cell wall biosynthesis
MKLPSKIFVVSHEATYTGAPILLLNLLHVLKDELNIKFTIFIVRDGDLRNDFSEVGKVIVFKKAGYAKRKFFLHRLHEFILSRIILVISVIKSISYPLIFSNTLINAQVYKYFNFFKKPTVVYVHELSNIIRFYPLKKHILPLIIKRNYFFFPSEAVKTYLTEQFAINTNRLFKLNYFIPDLNIMSSGQEPHKTELVKIGPSLVVCGMGVASPRKGTDIFIEVASIVCNQRKDIRFVWIGGFANTDFEKQYYTLIEKYNISHAFQFTGKLHPIAAKKQLSKSDLLFLSSREDPYPLVVLEAAMYGIPSIVFKDGGGITDFVNIKSGWIVNDFSPELVSEIIINIIQDDLSIKGKMARQYYKVKHESKELVISQFLNCIDKI